MTVRRQGPTKGEAVRAGTLTSARRRHQYLTLRAEGRTYDQIAEEMGVSASTVRRVLDHYLDRLAEQDRQNAPRVLQLEVARLDELERELWPRVRAGQMSAIDRLLKVMERRSRLLGLDAPQRHRVEHRTPAAALGIDEDEIRRMEEAWLRQGPEETREFTKIVDGQALELPPGEAGSMNPAERSG